MSVSEQSPAGEIAAGYAFSGPVLELGALLWGGECHPDTGIRIGTARRKR